MDQVRSDDHASSSSSLRSGQRTCTGGLREWRWVARVCSPRGLQTTATGGERCSGRGSPGAFHFCEEELRGRRVQREGSTALARPSLLLVVASVLLLLRAQATKIALRLLLQLHLLLLSFLSLFLHLHLLFLFCFSSFSPLFFLASTVGKGGECRLECGEGGMH